MSKLDTEDNILMVQCDSRDDMLVAEYIHMEREDDYPMVFLSFYVSAFYTAQHTAWDRWWSRIKLAFTVMRGKDYQLQEIVLSGSAKFLSVAEFFAREARRASDYEQERADPGAPR